MVDWKRSRQVVMVQNGKKYVVYDKLGKVVIITVDRNVAINYARGNYSKN